MSIRQFRESATYHFIALTKCENEKKPCLGYDGIILGFGSICGIKRMLIVGGLPITE
jgi:hypothetical protein